MQYEEYISRIIEYVLEKGMPKHTCFNVNIPNVQNDSIQGIKFCTQAHAFWADRFDRRMDQFGRPYFWLTGEFGEVNPKVDSDLHALANAFISIVPTQFDLTNYAAYADLKSLKI
jgi:5'-nucleotidase